MAVIPLDNEVPDLIVLPLFFASAPLTVKPKLKIIKESKGRFVSVIPEACQMAGIMDKNKAEIQKCLELIATHSTNSECGAVFVSFGKPNTRYTVDSDGLLV